MTGGWPPTDLPGLHVNAHARPPTADYRCRCGWTDAAVGDQIPAITTRINQHRGECPRPATGPPSSRARSEGDP